MGQGPKSTKASSMSGFSALLFHVLIVWGLTIETLVKGETLDKLTFSWPSFLTCEMYILLCEMVVGTSIPHTLPGTWETLRSGSQYFILHLKVASLTWLTKANCPSLSPASSFLPHWDSVREHPREICQGVESLELECDFFCFNPFPRGPGDSPKPLGIG